MAERDFRIKKGLVANGDITTSGSGDLRANERDVIANEIIAGYGAGDALFRTYNTGDHLKLQTYDSGTSAFTTSLEVMDNKEGIKTYNMFRSGHDNVLFGTNMYPLGNTGSTQANDWYEVFKWEFNQTMSSTTSAQYQNFSFSAEVVGRGIQTVRYQLYGRGEYGVQDTNGWWTTTFTVEGLNDVSSEDVFLLVFNAGTSLSKPNAKLYYKRTENWELRGIKINSMFKTSNFTFTFEDTNVGETTPTNDGNTGSSDKSPGEFFEARFGNGDNTNNKELYRGLATTNVFFDTSTERMGIGEETPSTPLHIKSTTTTLDNLLTLENNGASGVPGVGIKMFSNVGTTNYLEILHDAYGNTNFKTTNGASTYDKQIYLQDDGEVTFEAGNVGIGTTSPSTELHLSGASHPSIRVTGTDNAGADPAIELLGTADDFTEGGQLWYDNGTGVLHLASIYNNDAADIQFHTRTGADRSTSNVRMTIAGDGNVGIGTTDPVSPLHVDHNVSNPSIDAPNSFGIYIDSDLSGSTATGGDREQGGLFIDLDSSATGGDGSDEHRPYGVWADVRINSEADPDSVVGIYGYTEAQRSGSTAASTYSVRGGYFFAATDETSDHTVTELTGALGYASIQDAGTVTTAHGLRSYTNVHSGRTTNTGTLRGVTAEVDIAGGRTDGSDITASASSVFHAILDHNPAASGEGTVTIANSYLYYGSSSITDSSQVTNNYGLYLTNEDKNYFSSKVGIGVASPSNLLHIHGDMADGKQGILITRDDSSTVEDNLLGGIGFDSSDGNIPSSITEASVAIVGYAAEDHGTGDKGGYLSILLSEINDDDDTTSPEVMRVSTVSAGTSTTLRLRNNNTSMPNDTKYGSIEFYNADASGAGVGATIDALSNGSGRGGYLQFRTDADGSGSPSVRMTIDESGLVGIGTTSPEYELDVDGTIRILPTISSNAGTAIRIGAGGNSNDITLLRIDGGDPAHQGESDSAQYGFSMKYMGSGTILNNRYAMFMDNEQGTPIEAMSILQNGKVGIGVTVPTDTLAVSGGIKIGEFNSTDGTGYAGTSPPSDHNNSTGGGDPQIRVAGRTSDAPGIIQMAYFDNNNFFGGTGEFILGKLQYAMNENSNTVTTVAEIRGITSDPQTAGNFDGALKFLTSQGDTSSANLTEKMILTSDGYLGIGTSSPQANLHISSGTSGDAVLILEADTDNNDEADQPFIVFEQDGGVQHSAIGSFSGENTDNNALIFSNSVDNSGVQAGIVFKTGTAAGYASATESMRIYPSGETQARKTRIYAASSSTNTLTDADSGKTIYWTTGSLTLPDTAESGQQFVVINNRGGSATPGLGASNSIASGWTAHAAMDDETARTYIAVAANTWIYIG